MVALDFSSDSGYSGWTQTPSGKVVMVDYTNEQLRNATWEHARQPLLRSYVVSEGDLLPPR